MKLQKGRHILKPEVEIFELRDDADMLIACIYPTRTGLKIVSAFIRNHPLLVLIDPDDPPAILINLEGLP